MMKQYFLPALLGVFLAMPSAHAKFEVEKKKGETVYQVVSKWEPERLGYTGMVGFFAYLRSSGTLDGVYIMASKRAILEQEGWPWRRCPEVTLYLDGEGVVLSESSPPDWEYNEGRQAFYNLTATIEQIEQALVAKEAAVKVCDDRIVLTPSIRLDLMKLRDAYRKH